MRLWIDGQRVRTGGHGYIAQQGRAMGHLPDHRDGAAAARAVDALQRRIDPNLIHSRLNVRRANHLARPGIDGRQLAVLSR